MSKIAIRRCSEYDKAKVKEALLCMIDATDFPAVKDKRILVKPNIVTDAAMEKAITTHPVVLEAFLEILKEMGAAKILVGDSPGIQGPAYNARTCGIRDVVEKSGSVFSDFTRNPRNHKVYRNISVPMAKALDDADIIFSLAKFKTHQLMMYTGAVKNMFGLVPGLNKSPLHLKCPSQEEFARLIISIFRESHTDYAIIDGIIGMEGAGPSNGTPRKVGLLISSSDAFAADYAEAAIMGYSLNEMFIVREGIKENLTDIRKYSYPLLSPDEVIIKDFEKVEGGRKNLFSALILPFFSRYFKTQRNKKRKAPEFQDNCIKCRRCIDICPAKALMMGEYHPEISTRSCIRCYCCHEMCPVNAIKV